MNRWIVYRISHFCGILKHLAQCDLEMLVSRGFVCKPQQLQTELTFCGWLKSVISSICVYVCVQHMCVCVCVKTFFRNPDVLSDHFPILKPRLWKPRFSTKNSVTSLSLPALFSPWPRLRCCCLLHCLRLHSDITGVSPSAEAAAAA